MAAMIESEEKRIIFLKNQGIFNNQPISHINDASSRSYFRYKEKQRNVLLMEDHSNKNDMVLWIKIAEYLNKNGFSSPEIYGEDIESGFLLIEDFGENSFCSILENGNSKLSFELYNSIPQILSAFSRCSDTDIIPIFELDFYLTELSYFTDWYLPYLKVNVSDSEKQEFFKLWTKVLLPVINDYSLSRVFIHKDFHSNNLFWLPSRVGIKKVGLIDFQHAKLGSPVYDLVSFVQDSRRENSIEFTKKIISRYLSTMGFNKEIVEMHLNILGAQRNFKILGNICNLHMAYGKSSYLIYLPRVLNNLKGTLNKSFFREINHWVEEILKRS